MKVAAGQSAAIMQSRRVENRCLEAAMIGKRSYWLSSCTVQVIEDRPMLGVSMRVAPAAASVVGAPSRQ